MPLLGVRLQDHAMGDRWMMRSLHRSQWATIGRDRRKSKAIADKM